MKRKRSNAGRAKRAALAAMLGGFVLATAEASVPEGDASESIVVTGTKMSREEAQRRAVEFVRSTGVANGHTSVARWVEPVCPRVLGLADKHAQVVEAKLRAIAEAAEINVARAPCKTNIAVSFTPDAGPVMRAIATKSPRRLAEVPSGARDSLVEGNAPVRWWYSTDTRSRHGMRGRGNPPPGTGGDPDAMGGSSSDSVISSGVPTIMHYDSSIISTQAIRVLTSATVVVDVSRIERLPLDAVAAYAAFVAFAEVRAADQTPPGSILGLFEADSAAREMSEWDLAFLRALYRLPLDRQAPYHRGFLVRELIAATKPEG
jgi:hypothetical protein